MSASSAHPSGPAPPRIPEDVRFLTRFYHHLKGWCYLPAGLLLLGTTLTTALLRPEWLSITWVPPSLAMGSAVCTGPWAYYMHRQYRRAYGHVLSMAAGREAPLGHEQPSLLLWAAYLVGMMAWLAILLLHIPHTLGYGDNRLILFFVALFLSSTALHAPNTQHRAVYGGATLVLIGVTLLPLLAMPVVLVQTICYSTLGIVVTAVGAYNHTILLDAFGPITLEKNETAP